jgi:hydroxymethylglutaryl-CoA lyase
MTLSLPKSIVVREVGPREGFQSEPLAVPVEKKVAFVDALSATGITSIQVTSLVNPKAVWQHADAEEVMARVTRRPGVELAVLVPNVRGAQRAATVNADEWSIMLSASDAHARANSNATFEEALQRTAQVVELGREAGVRLRGGTSMGLGDPAEGRIPEERLTRIVRNYVALGVTEVGMADTAGMADPGHVYRTMSHLIEQFPEVTFKLHLHDTRGLGLANVIAGMAAGVRVFDSSVGGLGGCPFVPGASGNICTEDLVHMCHQMGTETGVDLDALLQIADTLPDLVGHQGRSPLSSAGTVDQLMERTLQAVRA